jgi:transcriptional regulator of heat shock response
MVMKKKNGKDEEVQDGWKGHIVPFELAQELYLSNEKAELKAMQDKLAEIPSDYEELLESLSEDEKETISEALDENNEAFVFKNIKGMVKQLKADKESANLVEVLLKADELNTKEKTLKASIKQKELDLHLKTKTVIENLSADQIQEVLHEKWISPVTAGILKLSGDMLDGFTKNIENLSSKYAITMADLEKEGLIEKTHTSSGRVPSNKGYHFYIDNLREKTVDKDVKYQLANIFTQREKSIDDVIKESCEILSHMTNLASVVLGPNSNDEHLLSVSIYPLSNNSATAVFVTDKGYV